MAFDRFYITDKGADLLAKAQIGGKLVYTKAIAGDGELGSQLPIALTDLIHQVTELTITELDFSSPNIASVQIHFSNKEVQFPFSWREIGLFAKGDDGVEILYAYGNAADKADYIPSYGTSPTEFLFLMNVAIGNASSVTAQINTDMIYATKQDLANMKSIFTVHAADDTMHSPYAVAVNSGNDYSVTLTPAPTAYKDGMKATVKINADSTGAATINVNGLGAKPVYDSLGNAVASFKANMPYTVCYESSADRFIVLGKGGGGTAQPENVAAGMTFTNDTGTHTGTSTKKYGVGETIPVSNIQQLQGDFTCIPKFNISYGTQKPIYLGEDDTNYYVLNIVPDSYIGSPYAYNKIDKSNKALCYNNTIACFADSHNHIISDNNRYVYLITGFSISKLDLLNTSNYVWYRSNEMKFAQISAKLVNNTLYAVNLTSNGTPTLTAINISDGSTSFTTTLSISSSWINNRFSKENSFYITSDNKIVCQSTYNYMIYKYDLFTGNQVELISCSHYVQYWNEDYDCGYYFQSNSNNTVVITCWPTLGNQKWSITLDDSVLSTRVTGFILHPKGIIYNNDVITKTLLLSHTDGSVILNSQQMSDLNAIPDLLHEQRTLFDTNFYYIPKYNHIMANQTIQLKGDSCQSILYCITDGLEVLK